jgi:hypothetical protein
MTVKKATSKRDRKYGKKDENGTVVKKAEPDKIVRIMVDYGHIMKFKNNQEAQAFMNKINKEAERTGMAKTSFVIIN